MKKLLLVSASLSLLAPSCSSRKERGGEEVASEPLELDSNYWIPEPLVFMNDTFEMFENLTLIRFEHRDSMNWEIMRWVIENDSIRTTDRNNFGPAILWAPVNDTVVFGLSAINYEKVRHTIDSGIYKMDFVVVYIEDEVDQYRLPAQVRLKRVPLRNDLSENLLNIRKNFPDSAFPIK